MLIWVGPSTRSNSLHHCWISQIMNPRKSALLRAVTSGEVSLRLQETARVLTQDPVDTVRLDALQLLENTDFEGKNFQVSWIGIVVVIIAWLMYVFALVLLCSFIGVFVWWSCCVDCIHHIYTLSTHIVVYHIRGAVHLGLVLACCWCSSTWVILGPSAKKRGAVAVPEGSCSFCEPCSLWDWDPFQGEKRDPDVDQWYPTEVLDLDPYMRSFDSKWLGFWKESWTCFHFGGGCFFPMVTKPAFLQHGIHQASKVS